MNKRNLLGLLKGAARAQLTMTVKTHIKIKEKSSVIVF
jgi:hypothetical protein